MKSKASVYLGPSDRTPVAASRRPTNENCVLFKDATIGLEHPDTPDDSGYHMVYRRVQELSSLNFESDNEKDINNLFILTCGVIYASVVWLSARLDILFDLPTSDSFQWLFIFVFPLVAMLLFANLIAGTNHIYAHLIAEVEPFEISLTSPSQFSSQVAAGISCMVVIASWLIEYGAVVGSTSSDLFILFLVAGCVLPNSPLHTRRHIFSKNMIGVDILPPREFYDLANDLIKKERDNIKAKKPIEDLVVEGETEKVEFKSSFWTNTNTLEKNMLLQDAVVKEIAGFLNAKHGGTLLIGVSDPEPHDPTGLVTNDVEHIGNKDKLLRYIDDILVRDLQLGNSAGYFRIGFAQFRGKEIIRIDVPRQAPRPILSFQPNRQKEKNRDTKKEFRFIRSVSKTEPQTPSDWTNYVLENWGKTE